MIIKNNNRLHTEYSELTATCYVAAKPEIHADWFNATRVTLPSPAGLAEVNNTSGLQPGKDFYCSLLSYGTIRSGMLVPMFRRAKLSPYSDSYPEDESKMFFRNIADQLSDYMVSQPYEYIVSIIRYRENGHVFLRSAECLYGVINWNTTTLIDTRSNSSWKQKWCKSVFSFHETDLTL
jgi:hypothetical protein